MERLEGVLIAGAGPVALVTALVLARAGLQVTLIEAEPAPVRSPRAIVYHSPTVTALDRLGVLDDALVLGMLKQDYQYRRPDGTILAQLDMSVIADDVPHPFNLHLGQDMLAEIVLRHLEATGRGQVRWGHRLTEVAQDAQGVTVTAETGDGPRVFHAPWLVGADGARSATRRALGLDMAGHTWPDRFVAINLHYDFERHGWARANFLLDPLDWAIIPVLDQQSGWRVTYGEDADLPEDTVADRAASRLARLLPDAGPYEIERIAPYRVHQRAVDRMRVGRVLLAGDAAHITNPCGGLGLTSGILDAVHLGDALAAVIQQRAPEGALDDYARERLDIFRNIASPAASENKRRLSEADPARRQADVERLRQLDGDPALQREALLFPNQLQSAPREFEAG